MAKRAFSCHFVMSMKIGMPLSPHDVPLPLRRFKNVPPSPLLFSSFHIVIVLLSMSSKKDPRNEVGAIVHPIANRALSDHTTKNIFGNVNFAKHFLQGTIMGFFDGHALGGRIPSGS